VCNDGPIRYTVTRTHNEMENPQIWFISLMIGCRGGVFFVARYPPSWQVGTFFFYFKGTVFQFWQIPRQSAFLFPVHAMFRHDCPLAVKPANTPRSLIRPPPPPQKKAWSDSSPIHMLFLLCFPWLVGSRVRNFRKDLWITLYFSRGGFCFTDSVADCIIS